jgi:glycosyltransferase involved in cell wall biosynthesis/hydroxymethylpyrimidine pyrophosphatase-like HAD family hydrolase
MKILLITEKYEPEHSKRDGGSRVVATLKKSFGNILSIMQFGTSCNSSATWNFNYPIILQNRFDQRIANAKFIAQQIKKVEKDFTHIFFIHISMQFSIIDIKLREDIIIWTFPMFLTPSYQISGESVPDQYIRLEKLALAKSNNIITPSYFEKKQLINDYSIPKEKIHVIPRDIDTSLLIPKIRSLIDKIKFCSIGSIKPQKNTLSLIDIFFQIQKKYPTAKLKIIGPVQNENYYIKLCRRIEKLGMNESVEFIGYLPPNKLFKAVQDCHIHISRSNCETFGRSIFETLACGIPNIARKTSNAAAEFLSDKPYAKFIDDETESVDAISEILDNFPQISSMALEVGKLYDEKIIAKLLVAKICNKEIIAISDFDGTLFHKKDPKRTQLSIEEFKRFPVKVICSARTIDDLLNQLNLHDLEVDWIIGFSGGVVADGHGNIICSVPLSLNEQTASEILLLDAKKLEADNKFLQISMPDYLLPNSSILNKHNLRFELYENTVFIADYEASKLHAIHRLLKHINWQGQVKVFGDSKYDMEMINYFDGIKISA